jgi:beta-galactosidase/beta-glucuronidase
MVREDWLCLNGEWEFEIDAGDSGLERGLLARALERRIVVPFAPEAPLSGVGNVDFMPAVWYRRSIVIPSGWRGRTVLLHFQAVDYDATVWVNGREVARHRGGFTPFSADLDGVAAPGQTCTIVVRARDPHRGPQPRGKQCHQYRNEGCLYTRTTGIWQTVWMEPVPAARLGRPRVTPNVATGELAIEIPIHGARPGLVLAAELRDGSGTVTTARARADLDLSAHVTMAIPESRRRLWCPEDPHLYCLELSLLDSGAAVVDRVSSYAGLRGISIHGRAVLLNGQKRFQRLVLDQGYYPDGIMTAPDDASLRRDIELSLAAGFNGARLHQKVFEERFLYHADRLGYLVWGEFPDWGGGEDAPATFITQWLEALERDYSHPSIIGWCGLNETIQTLGDRTTVLDEITRGMFLAAKAMDRTRPVLDASGYSHRVPEADVYDAHDYDQDPTTLAERHRGLSEGRPFVSSGDKKPWSIPYRGQPYFVSEFGGIWWNSERAPGEGSWGYGQAPRSLDEFYERFAGLCTVLLNNPDMFGYCYTQLTDVYQEQNGIYAFDRSAKLDVARIREIQRQVAAIEKA